MARIHDPRPGAAGERLTGIVAEMLAELASAQFGVPANGIVLVSERVVLKTSSGKIRRAASRDGRVRKANMGGG